MAFGSLATFLLPSAPVSAHDPNHSNITIVEAYTQTVPTVVDGKPELVRKLNFQRFGAHVENGDGTSDDDHNLNHAIYKAVPNGAGFDWSSPNAQQSILVQVPKCDVHSSTTVMIQYTDKVRTWTSNAGTTLDAVYVTGSGANVILEKADGTRVTVNSAALIQADQNLINTTYAPWVFILEEGDDPPDPIMIDPAVDRFQFADGTKNSVKERQGWVRHDFVMMADGASEIPKSMVMISDFETKYDIPDELYLLNCEIFNFATGFWENVNTASVGNPAVLSYLHLHSGEKGFRPRAYNFDFDYTAGQGVNHDLYVEGNMFKFRSSIWDRADGSDNVGRNKIESSPNAEGISVSLVSHGADFQTTMFMYMHYMPW